MTDLPTKQGQEARRAAFDLVDGVLRRHQTMDALFAPATASLAPRDRAFARLVAATVLRHLGRWDALIDEWMDRPLRADAQDVRHVLRLGLAQLIALGTPPHAAVDGAVSLLPARRQAFRGLVNAVLRRAAREGAARFAALDARLDLPHWLYQSWVLDWGAERADGLARAVTQEAALDITAPHADRWALAFEQAGLTVVRLGGDSLRLFGHQGAVDGLPGYETGEWWVQDAAAAWPARLFGRPGHVIELCAAPGGKTAQLLHQGAQVTALDLNPKRLAVMARNMERLRLAPTLVEADAKTWQPSEKAAAVLLDAPCSATGTIRRHPDLPWLKRPQDLSALVEVQRAMIANAARMLAPGGRLVYAVCSIQKPEGEDQTAWALAQDMGLALDPGPDLPQGEWRIFPGQPIAEAATADAIDGGYGDGFYIARFRKI